MDIFQYLWKNSQMDENDNLEINYENSVFLEQLLIMKLMMMVPILQVNEDFEDFTSRMDEFLNHSKNQKFLKKYY